MTGEPLPEPTRCARCTLIQPIAGLVYLSHHDDETDEWTREELPLCGHCYELLRRSDDNLVDCVPVGKYPFKRPPMKLSPEVTRHLLPHKMTEDAPTGSPLGSTPSHKLVAYCDYNASASIHQDTAEQQMAEEVPALWAVWTRAKIQGDATVAAKLGLPVWKAKELIKEARKWLEARVTAGGVSR